jgi:hypothetical protein
MRIAEIAAMGRSILMDKPDQLVPEQVADRLFQIDWKVGDFYKLVVRRRIHLNELLKKSLNSRLTVTRPGS